MLKAVKEEDSLMSKLMDSTNIAYELLENGSSKMGLSQEDLCSSEIISTWRFGIGTIKLNM